jgi:hypothetical protein
MNFRLIKRVRKMKAIFAIIFIVSSANANAFFWDSKISILCYGGKSLDLILTYELKDREIYEEIIMPKTNTKSGKDELISMVRLEDCTIKNSKNWICGGKSTYHISGIYRSESHIVYEGRYKHVAGSSGSLATCDKRVQAN